MHRDLKLANILIHFPGLSREQAKAPGFNMKEFLRRVVIVPGSDGHPTDDIVIKIADLGFARKLAEGELAQTRLGTPLIMAPEVLDGNPYD